MGPIVICRKFQLQDNRLLGNCCDIISFNLTGNEPIGNLYHQDYLTRDKIKYGADYMDEGLGMEWRTPIEFTWIIHEIDEKENNFLFV